MPRANYLPSSTMTAWWMPSDFLLSEEKLVLGRSSTKASMVMVSILVLCPSLLFQLYFSHCHYRLTSDYDCRCWKSARKVVAEPHINRSVSLLTLLHLLGVSLRRASCGINSRENLYLTLSQPESFWWPSHAILPSVYRRSLSPQLYRRFGTPMQVFRYVVHTSKSHLSQ